MTATSFLRWPELPAKLAAMAAAYYVAGRLGLLLAIPPGYATAVWPASGIALAGTLLFGYRVWPGILLGSFLINLRTSLDTTSTESILNTTALAASIGMGASLQAIVGAFLIRRFTQYPTAFVGARDIIKFLLLGGPVSCLVNATWGVTSLLLLGGVIHPVDYLFHWWTWWVGDAIGVITFTPLILIWAAKPAVISQRKQVSLALCLAFTLVVIFFIYTNAWEQDRIKLEFKRRTDQLAHQLQENLDSYILVLHSVENLYASSVPINRQQFKTFVSRWFSRYPGIRAVSWSPRVLDSERANYEQAAREDGLSNFEITEQNPKGQLVRAARRAEYIPVYYLESVRGTGRALGFDAASDSTRREALNQARDTGKPTATDPLTLIQDIERERGFVVFLPIYKPGRPQNSLHERRLNLQGYVSGAFRINDMMTTALKGARTEDIEIRLYDARDGEKKRLLYEHRSKERGSQYLPVGPESFQRLVTFEIAGRQWMVQFAPTKEYLIAQRGWQAWSVLAGGLFFTGLLGGFLLTLTGHTVKLQAINTDLEKEISERKSAEDAVAQLAAIVESSNDAIIGTTMEGVIISWNKGAEIIYGYSVEEVKGRPISILIPSDRLDEPARLRERIKQGEHVAQYETIRVRKGGAQVHVSLTLSPMKDATSKITAVATIAHNITERKRAESELQRLQQLAAARERTRLARDLHDSVLQSLAVAGLNLEAAIQGLKVDPKVAREQLRGVQDLIVREQRELRSLIEELKLAALVPGEMDFKIGYLLQQLAKTVEQQWHLRVELKMDGLDGQVPAPLAREIYQIIREGVVNAARHAHASVVEVDLKADDHNARVTVSDNGCGFPFRGHYDDAALTSTGLGPAIIKSRVASLGGALNIDSTESGARLEVTLPLSSPRG
ncbi:MAG TPA: CHASE domain-containing protein [Candidatus Binatia bacterium]|nr:CHASE domain-containing protein [Candidatus Binatia bacterium]